MKLVVIGPDPGVGKVGVGVAVLPAEVVGVGRGEEVGILVGVVVKEGLEVGVRVGVKDGVGVTVKVVDGVGVG